MTYKRSAVIFGGAAIGAVIAFIIVYTAIDAMDNRPTYDVGTSIGQGLFCLFGLPPATLLGGAIGALAGTLLLAVFSPPLSF